jgi:predicted nucleic acid-binding protein
MEIVLDTNILISSLLKEGLTRKIILISPFEMHTLEFANYEMDVHKEELLLKSKLDEKSYDLLKEVIFDRVNLVPLEEIEAFRGIAEEIMGDIDIDDSPFLALAMSLKCPIWSNDVHFKRQNVVKAFSTKERSWNSIRRNRPDLKNAAGEPNIYHKTSNLTHNAHRIPFGRARK